MEIITGMIKIMTLNNANTCTLFEDYFECFNCLFSKKCFAGMRSEHQTVLDPDQVPYFGGPDLGSKSLQSRRYHAQS